MMMNTNKEEERQKNKDFFRDKKRISKMKKTHCTYLLHFVQLPRPMDGVRSHSILVLQ
jgi:hypothetical protein